MPDKILIAGPTYGQNDSRFTTTMFQLSKLRGTDLMQIRRSLPDIARNNLADQALKAGYDFIFFFDDDMVIVEGHPAKLLDILIEQMKADPSIMVLAPRAYQRHPPFTPCVYRSRGDGTYDSVDESKAGLIDVDAIHFAATLVRPDLFRKLPKPWFEFKDGPAGRVGEDITLSSKARSAGLRLCCDTNLQVQHLSDPTLIDEEAYLALKPKSAILTP